MYHPGRVLEVLSNIDKNIKSSDDSTQAVIEMWDENQFTFLVANPISKKIKKGDVVLVDYRPISDKVPVPNHIVVKILGNKLAQDVWKQYQKFHEKNKQAAAKSMGQNLIPQYMG